MLRAVIFDFDYTLGDTTDGIVAAFNYAFTHMGQAPHKTDEIKATVGRTLHDAYRILTGDSAPAAADTFYDLFQTAAKETLVPSASLYPDTLGVLDFFRRRGCRLGIVSTKHRHQIVDIFDKFGITGVFGVIVGAEDVKEYKPAPEGLLLALSRLGTSREDALYVGDSFIDGQTAQNAGVPFAAVLTGTTGRDELLRYSPLTVADGIGGVAEFFGGAGWRAEINAAD